jgi:hypothetical protein
LPDVDDGGPVEVPGPELRGRGSSRAVVMTPLPRQGRCDGDGPGEQFGEELLEPPPAVRRELGPDRCQRARR